jgi:hypothetical protein
VRQRHEAFGSDVSDGGGKEGNRAWKMDLLLKLNLPIFTVQDRKKKIGHEKMDVQLKITRGEICDD